MLFMIFVMCLIYVRIRVWNGLCKWFLYCVSGMMCDWRWSFVVLCERMFFLGFVSGK